MWIRLPAEHPGTEMKSIQFNYFAYESDLEFIANAILAWSPSATIFAPRRQGTEIQGAPVVKKSQLIPISDGVVVFHAIDGYEDQVRTDIVSDEISRIAIRDNPVLEYSPSAPVDGETVKFGRFYASSDDQEFKNKIRVLFASLKNPRSN